VRVGRETTNTPTKVTRSFEPTGSLQPVALRPRRRAVRRPIRLRRVWRHDPHAAIGASRLELHGATSSGGPRGGGTGYYCYGAGGQRLRKVIDQLGSIQLEWIFLGAVSIFRRRRRETGEIGARASIATNRGRNGSDCARRHEDSRSERQ
jgi:hypothetical protein